MIARGTITTSLTGDVGTSTFSHTVSGATPILVLITTSLGATGSTVTGATYGAQAMTALDDNIESVQTPRFSLRCFYLVNPPTGANDVVVSLTGQDCASIAMTYNGVKQAEQPDARNEAINVSGGDGDYTEAITTVADNSWVLMLAVTHYTGGLGVIESSTEAQEFQATVSAEDFFLYIFDTNTPKTPPGSVTMGWQELGSGIDATHQVFSIAPAPSLPNVIFY